MLWAELEGLGLLLWQQMSQWQRGEIWGARGICAAVPSACCQLAGGQVP